MGYNLFYNWFPVPPHAGVATVTNYMAARYSSFYRFLMATGRTITQMLVWFSYWLILNRADRFWTTKGTLHNRFIFLKMVELAITWRTSIPIAVVIYFSAFKYDGQALHKGKGHFLAGFLVNPCKSGTRNVHDAGSLQMIIHIVITQSNGFIFFKIKYDYLSFCWKSDGTKTFEMGRTDNFSD
jgi:hypothetical protein